MKEAYRITRHTQPIFLMGAALGVSGILGFLIAIFFFLYARDAYPHHGWLVYILLGILCSIVIFAIMVRGHIKTWKKNNPSGTERPDNP